MNRQKTAQFRAHMHQHHQTKGNTMATFKFEIVDTSVLDGVRKEVKPSYVWKFPTELDMFADLINAAKAQKGKKNLRDEWVFIGVPKLRNKLEAESIRSDVYELNHMKEGKHTLRSRVKEYTQDGETFWMLSIRYLSDAEQHERDTRKAKKEANKDAVSASDLAKVLAKIK